MMDIVAVNQVAYKMIRLLGHGKGGYSYLVEKDGLKIAWIQIASGGNNLIDHLTICGELKFKKLIYQSIRIVCIR